MNTKLLIFAILVSSILLLQNLNAQDAKILCLDHSGKEIYNGTLHFNPKDLLKYNYNSGFEITGSEILESYTGWPNVMSISRATRKPLGEITDDDISKIIVPKWPCENRIQENKLMDETTYRCASGSIKYLSKETPIGIFHGGGPGCYEQIKLNP
jgi:hypothetical protein